MKIFQRMRGKIKFRSEWYLARKSRLRLSAWWKVEENETRDLIILLVSF